MPKRRERGKGEREGIRRERKGGEREKERERKKEMMVQEGG